MKIAQFNHALSDPTRWRIVMLVAESQLCVCELEDGLRLPQSTLSSHLLVLKGAGLLEVERHGKWAFYRLSAEFKPLITQMATHFASSMQDDATLKADRMRIAKRVAMRGGSDCGRTTRRLAIPPILVEISS